MPVLMEAPGEASLFCTENDGERRPRACSLSFATHRRIAQLVAEEAGSIVLATCGTLNVPVIRRQGGATALTRAGMQLRERARASRASRWRS